MRSIILSPEQTGLPVLRALVTAKEFRALEDLQYIGGFKRFDLSLYDEGKHLKGKSGMPEVTAWLKPIMQHIYK